MESELFSYRSGDWYEETRTTRAELKLQEKGSIPSHLSGIESEIRSGQLLQRPLLHVILPIDRLDLRILCIVELWANKCLSVNPVIVEEPGRVFVSII